MSTFKTLSQNACRAIVIASIMLTAGALPAFAAQAPASEQASQAGPVKGVVVDAAGEPVIGASIIVKGTRNGVVTDLDGGFSINAAAGSVLQVSCIGYVNQEITVAAGQDIKVVLAEDTEMLEETVVIGYGVQKKSDLTGAISSVSSEALENRSVNNIASAFTGKVAGVQVISNSGDPGSIGTIRIRGISSNSSSANNPLYIVDGLQVSDLKTIDPQNVESIEILKDAASAAIYGAQAGNGVVVITTKSGKKGEGKVFYNGSYTIEKLGYHPTVMNAEQYIDFVTEGGYITPAAIEATWDGVTDTDWFKEMFPGGYAQRHTVGVQGANDKASYYTSLSLLDNDGMVYGDRDRLKRFNVQLNASYQIKKWLKIGTTNTFQIRSSSSSLGSMGGGDFTIMGLTYGMDPLTPISYKFEDLPSISMNAYNEGKNLIQLPNGEYIGVNDITVQGTTPLVDLYKNTDSMNKDVNLNGTMYLNLTPFKGLTFTSRFGYQFGASNDYSFKEPYFVSITVTNEEYSFSESASWKLKYQWENFANYNLSVGKHNFDAMAGMSYIESNSVSISGSTDTLKDYKENFRYLDYSTADANDSISGSRSRSASLSYFGRIGYNYDSRYYIQANFRADAFDSSKLSSKYRWGYFPSVSAGWNITNEPWMQNVNKNVLSYLKLRASWGINGNIGVLSGYPYATTVTIGGSQVTLGTDDTLTLASYPSGLANDNLRWEESKQLDFGVDARFFNNRLSATLDLYNKNTDGLLVSVTPSYTTGHSSVYMNAGAVNNKGIELELTWKDSIGDFNYSISGNIAHNDNMVTYLDPSITKISGSSVNNGHTATYFQQGYEAWYFSGYVFEGIDPETGNPIYKDIDGDGKISTSDIDVIGSATPDFTYGLTFSAEYKGFDLTVFGNGSYGNDIWYGALRATTVRNLPTVFYEKAWRQPGDVTDYPRFSQVMAQDYARSSACIYDGSYFRINQLQLGYTLPKHWLKSLKMENIRVYASLDNWFTFSDYIGFDPVTASDNTGSGVGIDRGTYPSSKKAMFGINLSF